MMKAFGLIEGGPGWPQTAVRYGAIDQAADRDTRWQSI